MSKIRQNYDEEFKKNAVRMSYATPKKMKDFAADLGIHVRLIYRWRKIYTEGDKTKLAEQQDSLCSSSSETRNSRWRTKC